MKNWRYKLILLGLIIGALSLQACGLHPYSYKPSGKGPFPAVIVLHTRGGIRDHLYEFASDLSRQGYVTSIVDYGIETLPIVENYDQLITLPEVDPNRIGMVGFSQGAGYTLHFTLSYPDRKIRGIVNYYAGCGWGCWHIERPHYPPALFLHGDLDDSVQPFELNDFCEMQRNMDKICEVHIYKGVYHAFDQDSPYYPGGLDYVTTVDAFQRAVAFLDKHVKGKSK